MQDVERVARVMAPSVFEPFDPEKHGSPVNHEFTKSMWMKNATTAISAMPDATGLQISSEVLAFLKGSGPLDGVHFGEPHPTERGAFWWRKHLPSSMLKVPQCAGCEGNPAPENSPCAVCGMAMPDSFDRGWNAAIEAAVKVADNAYAEHEQSGLTHPEDSDSRSRCFARARSAMYISQAISQLKKDTGNLAPTTTDSV